MRRQLDLGCRLIPKLDEDPYDTRPILPMTRRPARPLQGVRVLDLSQAASGPICASYLAAYGASVIKIERPGTGDMARRTPPYGGEFGVSAVRQSENDISTTVLKRNRNKQSLALDLASPDGLRVFERLVLKADVVIENFRPGVSEKLKVDYNRLRSIKSDLIYCSITGFGMSGPYKDWSAFDTIVQGMSGLMAMTGFPGGPPTKAGLLVADTYAPLFALSGILAALRHRDQTGEGQFIEVSMFDCLVSLMWDEPIEFFVENDVSVRSGNRLLRIAPWNTYQCNDGFVVICAGQHEHWRHLCEVMERVTLFSDPRFASMESRLENVDALDREIEAWTRQRSRHEVVHACQTAAVPCGPVNEIRDLIDDPHLRARGLLQPLLHPLSGKVANAKAAGFPVRFSGFDVEFDQPAPAMGQHTSEILSNDLGMSKEQIIELESKKAIQLTVTKTREGGHE